MARVLFVVPPFVGHVAPTVAVAASLRGEGHRVGWVGVLGPVRKILPEPAADVVLLALDEEVPAAAAAREEQARWQRARGAARLKLLWEEVLLPLAHAMVPGVHRAIDAFRPDVVVVDQQALAGAAVAESRDLAWATSATTSAGLTDPLRGLPSVRAWRDAQVQAFLNAAGGGRELSPFLVLAFTTRAMLGSACELPPATLLVGPALGGREQAVVFPWNALRRSGAKLLVTLGTLAEGVGTRFLGEMAVALGGQDLQVIVAAGSEHLANSPPNFLVRRFVPQLSLLPLMDAVVCHAGHNTVVEALAHALPLVVAPIRDDQPVIAEQVVAAGAGLRVSVKRTRAQALAQAVARVLGEESFREAASRIRNSFLEAGGAERAAEAIVSLGAKPLGP